MHLDPIQPLDDIFYRAGVSDDEIVERAKILCLCRAEHEAAEAYRKAVRAKAKSDKLHRQWIKAKARLVSLGAVL